MNHRCLSLAAATCLLAVAGAEPIFQDGFESGLNWTVTKTYDGRVAVTGDHGPASGSAHLVLDDATSDAGFSVAEASIMLDLTDKKNVTLNFMAKSLGNEAHAPPSGNFTGTRTYDGVAISCDGGVTWRSVQSLAAVAAEWTSFSLPLDSSVTALAGSYGPGFRIRFSGYDNSPAPLDGIAIDNVALSADVDPRITVEMPGTVAEGSGPHTGFISINVVQASPVTIALSSASPAIVVPATATIAAGELSASFPFSAPEDSLVTLTRSAVISASATGFSLTPASIAVTDNETAQATLSVPAQLLESATPSGNATITLNPAPAIPVIFSLAGDPAAELTLPATVTLQAGQTQVAFNARATNDTKIDGDITATVTASAAGLPLLSAATTTVDNETRTLTLTVPTFVMEGATGTCTVAISGTLADGLPVSLEAAANSGLVLPASVFIPAGFSQVTFPVTALNNNLVDGTRNIALTATAASFTASSKNVVVRDNDAASFALSALTDLVPIGSPQNLTVTALDQAGNTISGFGGTVNLDLLLPNGSTLPLTPPSATLSGSGWTGTVTLPAGAVSGSRIRVSDAGGHSGLSNPFDPIRSLTLTTADLLWNPLRGVIYASVPASAGGAYAGCVVEINPATLAIERSVLMIQDPGQLALTSGGEYLYAVQNGNARVAKIDPATMSVISSFAVGIDNSRGTLFASDICTVAGQPEVVLISRKAGSGSPAHIGVAAYDSGVERAAKTQEHTDPVRIEPSADPAKFWCYTGSGVRRLALAGTGVSVAATTSNIGGGNYEMRAVGDRMHISSGEVFNGANLTKLGTIPSSGPHYPDGILNRTYFLEKSSPSSGNFNRIGSYDSTSFTLIKQSTMPSVGTVAGSLIRWSNDGLAFRSATQVFLVNSAPLVPASQPADLTVSVTASPTPVAAGGTLSYTVQVKNLGPNLARGVVLAATLSSGQTLQGATASAGSVTSSGSLVTLLPPDLANGATATLTITVQAGSAGGVSCNAKAVSNVVDPDFSNNLVTRSVNVGYLTATDSVNRIQLNAKSLIADPTRNLLWVALSQEMTAPLGNSVVSVDPLTGLVSDPIALNAQPNEGSIALSSNGRYLYVGLSGVAAFARIDLSQDTPVAVRIPAPSTAVSPSVRDIEVLDGDGTSVLVVDTLDSLQVIDGETPRAVDTSIYEASDVEHTATPGVFFGHNANITSHPASRLAVTASGVEVIQAVDGLLFAGSFARQISSAGDRILSDGGHLADAASMSLIATLPVYGAECLDGQHHRAYIVNGNALHRFDSDTGQALGSFPLPAPAGGDWAIRCVRWGIDGFAILGEDGEFFVGRWSGIIPVETDGNGDGIADAWAAALFGTIVVDPDGDGDHDGLPDALEYLFATSPVTPGSNPVQLTVEVADEDRTIRLRFPRRAGVNPESYRFELSEDAGEWLVAPGVTETVLSTATVDGVPVEQVEARIPMAWAERGFARIKWLHP